jgi:ABC-type Co2+ transport system, periplasmic component
MKLILSEIPTNQIIAMKSKSLVFFLVAVATFLPAIAWAGEFRGTLTKDGKPVPSAEIVIKSGTTSYRTKSESSGFYRVVVPETGSCTLTVTMGSQTFPSLTVTSYDRFVQIDLLITTTQDGKETLQMR